MNLFQELLKRKEKIAVVGLGYVGLPLAVEFGKVVDTIGFDLNSHRIHELQKGIDSNKEVAPEEFEASKFLQCTSRPAGIHQAKFFIVAVPTPVTESKLPDLSYVEKASAIIGEQMTRGSIVVFEPTVYPGVTEEICVPILEKTSGLVYKKDFKVGYSPERINPGDKQHTITNIVKIVSACDEQALEQIAFIYELVVKAGVFKAASIKVAEAAKVIENTQRDLNIALMNELALIFHKMNIDTKSVLEAAGTKWNFIKLSPGLVGGHCIGVDPYYLTYKAETLGYHPQVILSGRRINDQMGKYVAEQTVKSLIAAHKTVKDAKVLVMGITFKENVSDIRNSRVIDLIRELQEYGIDVSVCDPHADAKEVKKEYGLELIKYHSKLKVDAMVIAVAHDFFKERLNVNSLKKHLIFTQSSAVLIDVKGLFGQKAFEDSGVIYWRL